MNSIKSIIEKHLEKINGDWLKVKNKQFKASTIWEEDGILKYTLVETIDIYKEEFDKEGKLIFREIIGEKEEFTDVIISFSEFCKIGILKNEYYSFESEIIIGCYTGHVDFVFGLWDTIFDLIKDLKPFFIEIKSSEISDFINNVYDLGLEIIDDLKCPENEMLNKLRRDLIVMLRMELENKNFQKLEISKFTAPNKQKIKFNLTLEDFSALIRILEKGNIIFEEKNKILEFAENHFKYRPQGKEDYLKIPQDRLKKAMEKHGTSDHLGKGLENIRIKINNAIAGI